MRNLNFFTDLQKKKEEETETACGMGMEVQCDDIYETAKAVKDRAMEYRPQRQLSLESSRRFKLLQQSGGGEKRLQLLNTVLFQKNWAENLSAVEAAEPLPPPAI